MKNINEFLEQEKKNILQKDAMEYKIRATTWDKVAKNKIVHFHFKETDRVVELIKKMPLLTNYNDYKYNIIKSISNDENKENELAEFIVNSNNEELNFFLSQMIEDGGTSWFVNDYCFRRPILHEAINKVIESGNLNKVKTLFAFAYDDMLELRLSAETHPNSFSAYAENRCGQDVTSFLDSYLNQNSTIFNDYLTNVQNECLDYKTNKEFFHEIKVYNEVKQYDFDNQINNPSVLFKTYLLFKKLNEKKVWNTDKLFSVNEFIERDKKRAMFDDFNNTEVSEVQKLYEEIIKE